MSAQHLTRDICLARDICLFQGGQTHMQSELLQETGAKKGCGRRGGAGGATLKKTYILREILCGHSADIYLQGYMSALYPSSVFTSDKLFLHNVFLCVFILIIQQSRNLDIPIKYYISGLLGPFLRLFLVRYTLGKHNAYLSLN